MSRVRRLALRLVVASALVVAGLALPPAMTPALTGAEAAPVQCRGSSTPLDGLAREAHPVVLVHGWAGSPLTKSAEGLRRDGWQYLTFDYTRDATRWAAAPEVSACLARYLDEVSRRHRERGGDGIVYLVGHSMGGNAIQFALDPAYGGVPGLADRVGGVVALDTPFTGSAWGSSYAAEAWSNWNGDLPETDSRAWQCLSTKRPRGCARPPAIPFRVPVHQVIGMVTVRRAMFGVLAYEVPLSGDGIVSQKSQFGYADPGRGAVPFDTVSCTASADLLTDTTRALLDPVSFWTLADDNKALDLFGADQAAVTQENLPAVAQYGHLLLNTASCSHMRIPEDRQALTYIDRALSGMAARRAGITSASQLASAPIPASCRHEASRVRNGTKDFGVASDGPARGFATLALGQDDAAASVDPLFADVDDDGVTEGVVGMVCSAGGVTWPMFVLVYGHGPQLLGQVDLAAKGTTAEHADLKSMEAADGGIAITWDTYEGAGYDVRSWSGVVRPVLGGGTRRWELQEVAETTEVRTLDFSDGLLEDADAATSTLSGTDPGFVSFVTDLVDEQVAAGQECEGAASGVTVDRWRSDGWALGSVNACGGYQAIWGEEDGAWREVLGTQEVWGCTDLDAAGVPRELVDDQCA